MTNNDLYDFGLRIVRLIENDDLYVKALIVKDAEIERLREALKEIASTTKIITFENDQVVALNLLVTSHLKIARAALKEGE